MAGEHIIKHNNGIIIDGTGDGASPDTGITLKSYTFQYTSGSTKVIEYINTNNTLQLSANTTITGSLVVNGGSGVELQVASTGVTLGNVIGDTHRITGSLNISGSTNLNGNLIVSGNTTIGDATTDSITMTAATMSLGSGTGILNIDSNTFVVDGANNRVGLGKNNPSSTLDVNGNTFITGSLSMTGGITALLANSSFAGVSVSAGNTLTIGSTGVLSFSGATTTPGNRVAIGTSTQYRTTSTAGALVPIFIISPNGAANNNQQYILDWENSNGFVFAAGNVANNSIARASINITNLVNTTASESADLIFSTKPGSPANTAFAQRLRITSTGTTIISGTFAFSATSSAGPTGSRGAYNGEIVTFGAGTLTAGQLYFLSSSSTWSLANANSTGSSTGMLGIAVGTTPSDGLLIRGFAYSASYTTATGSIVYAATSSGLMTISSPSSSNHVVRVVGYVTNIPNTIYFDPDKTWVTLA